MSVGDITRLNRMYNCPNFEAAPIVKLNGESENSQFSNGTIMGVGANKPVDNTYNNDPTTPAVMRRMAGNGEISELNLNDTTLSNDEDDDMILGPEQIEALFSLNSMKRNGYSSAFNHWPKGIVPFEIDSTFCKTFNFYYCSKA